MQSERKRRAARVLPVLAALGLALAACAYPVDNGVGRPATVAVIDALDDADWTAQAQAFQNALETNKVGESANWSNPASGHLGTVTPTRTYTAKSGAPCREYQQTVTVSGETAITQGTACRQEDGTWETVAATDAARGYRYRRYAYGYPYCGYYPGYYGYGYGHYGYGHYGYYY
ncbi:MAG: RT0821/Lpp0805 family surface protein [Alphaproteobacteria bacterium]